MKVIGFFIVRYFSFFYKLDFHSGRNLEQENELLSIYWLKMLISKKFVDAFLSGKVNLYV